MDNGWPDGRLENAMPFATYCCRQRHNKPTELVDDRTVTTLKTSL